MKLDKAFVRLSDVERLGRYALRVNPLLRQGEILPCPALRRTPIAPCRRERVRPRRTREGSHGRCW